MNQATEQAAISVANKATGGGVIATGLGWVTSEIAIGICGLAIAAVGVCISWYYRAKDDRRKEKVAKAELARLAIK